jgi:hypothetical protein
MSTSGESGFSSQGSEEQASAEGNSGQVQHRPLRGEVLRGSAFNAYQALAQGAEGENDESVRVFLEQSEELLRLLTTSESQASVTEISERVDGLVDIFQPNRGEADISLDVRYPTKLKNIEAILHAILRTPFPGERSENRVVNLVRTARKAIWPVLKWTVGTHIREVGDRVMDRTPAAYNANRRILEQLLLQVQDARTKSRRRFVQGAVAGATGVLTGIDLMKVSKEETTIASGGEKQTGADRSSIEKPLAQFDIEMVEGRTIQFDEPFVDLTAINKDFIVYIGEQGAQGSYPLHVDGIKAVVPDHIFSQGGELKVFMQSVKSGELSRSINVQIAPVQ